MKISRRGLLTGAAALAAYNTLPGIARADSDPLESFDGYMKLELAQAAGEDVTQTPSVPKLHTAQLNQVLGYFSRGDLAGFAEAHDSKRLTLDPDQTAHFFQNVSDDELVRITTLSSLSDQDIGKLMTDLRTGVWGNNNLSGPRFDWQNSDLEFLTDDLAPGAPKIGALVSVYPQASGLFASDGRKGHDKPYTVEAFQSYLTHDDKVQHKYVDWGSITQREFDIMAEAGKEAAASYMENKSGYTLALDKAGAKAALHSLAGQSLHDLLAHHDETPDKHQQTGRRFVSQDPDGENYIVTTSLNRFFDGTLAHEPADSKYRNPRGSAPDGSRGKPQYVQNVELGTPDRQRSVDLGSVSIPLGTESYVALGIKRAA